VQPGLLQDIESHQVSGSVTGWSLGGAGFVLKGDPTIVSVDPFLDPDYHDRWVTRALPPPVDAAAIRRLDLLIATHEHPDHLDPVSVRAVGARTECLLAGPGHAMDLAASWGFPERRIRRLEPGDTLTVGGVHVTAWPSDDNLAVSALIYLIEMDGIRMVFSGDSLLGDGFRSVGLGGGADVAFLATARSPAGERWYMDPGELIEACALLGCRVLVPVHWDIWRELARDPDQLRADLRRKDADIGIALVRAGGRIELRVNAAGPDGREIAFEVREPVGQRPGSPE
jgi:L-ascorbate metabolism protein UlaG (beta-lactamase superfamily)